MALNALWVYFYFNLLFSCTNKGKKKEFRAALGAGFWRGAECFHMPALRCVQGATSGVSALGKGGIFEAFQHKKFLLQTRPEVTPGFSRRE